AGSIAVAQVPPGLPDQPAAPATQPGAPTQPGPLTQPAPMTPPTPLPQPAPATVPLPPAAPDAATGSGSGSEAAVPEDDGKTTEETANSTFLAIKVIGGIMALLVLAYLG